MISSTPIQYEPLWADAFASFIQYKRGLGLQYDRPEYELMALSRFLVSVSSDLEISKETAEIWCARREGESVKGWSYRVSVYRQLAIYLTSRGIKAYIPDSSRARCPKYVPYIFTEDEIRHILSVADTVKSKRVNSYDKIFPVVLRLMFSSGLRISEVVNIKATDVNIPEKVIYIHESKNRNSRLVPVDVSVANLLAEYMKTWVGGRTYFFETMRHAQINSSTVYKLFRATIFRAGIPHGGRGSGPRLHDIRHTFAVRSLHKMTDQGLDIYTALPYLSAYLGHKTIKETEHYLRLTAELYPEVEQLASFSTGYVVPEV